MADRPPATVRPVSESEATGRVAAIFADIKQTKKIDFVPRFWQVLATDPAHLEQVWSRLKATMHPEADGKVGRLDPLTREIIALAVSATNGCAYCVDMHSSEAKAQGESDARLHAVAVWREAPFFDERERAALELTEAVTRLSDGHGVPDDVWQQAAKHFDEHELAQLLMMITTINAWNRISVATRKVPASYQG